MGVVEKVHQIFAQRIHTLPSKHTELGTLGCVEFLEEIFQ